jgi:invasion protein IalB
MAQASKYKTQLDTVVAEYKVPIGDVLEQPLVEATVLSVKNTADFSMVALNVGSDNMVEKGMTFEIWAGDMYKGQVRVDNVTPNMCSALVTLAVDGASIAEGDNAATRL